MVNIEQKIANRKNFGSTRSTSNIKYIVIHYTANNGDSATSNGNYFANNVVTASSHYFVDDTKIVQSVPDNYVAYAVGGSKWNNAGGRLYGIVKNANSISIELCDVVKDDVIYPSATTINNALDLVRQLMSKYGIPKENVIRHYDVNGKPCPAYWVEDNRWKSEFWDLIDSNTNSTIQPITNSGNDVIRTGQQHSINFTGHQISVDGCRGPETREQAVRVVQQALNLDYYSGLVVDGQWGSKTNKAFGKHYVAKGEKQYLVTAAEILCMLYGKDPNGVECPGSFGIGLASASGGTKLSIDWFKAMCK